MKANTASSRGSGMILPAIAAHSRRFLFGDADTDSSSRTLCRR